MNILETNKKLWDDELKNGYGTHSFSEEDMIDWNKIIGHISNIKDMRVLDLGVGCGRSTEILLPLCKSYIGTDYSESGINAYCIIERIDFPIEHFYNSSSIVICICT